MLFGWYGLFLGPLLVVVGVHLARIVLPGLVHGDSVTGEVRAAESLGADPKSVVESPASEESAPSERTTDGGKATRGEAASEREE
jgi:hypothetical protein